MVTEEQFQQDDVELSLKRTEKLLQVRTIFKKKKEDNFHPLPNDLTTMFTDTDISLENILLDRKKCFLET